MIDDYSYEEQFADHYAANFIIVDKGATVTINAGIAPTVSGETFLITNEELQRETIKLNESLCSENNLVFGKMEASKLTFTFKDKNTYPTDLTETEIDVYLYFNGDSSSLFKVGTYTIDADKYSADRYTRSITAYDQIYYLKDVDITSWYNDYFGDGQRHAIGFAIVSLFNWIKDENDDFPDSPKIDIDIESGYNLTNALFTIGKTIESDSISFEFFMQRVLEWNGAFGHINRNGNFEFKVMQWYDAEPVRTVTNDDRIPPTEFDIVSTWGIGGIDVYDADNIRKFSVRNTNKKKPSIYTIVDSFVVADRDAGDSDVDTALKKLHQVINHYNYKSCKATCTGDLCVEVGDRINVNFFAEETDPRDWFRSYVLERTFTGIQGMTDVYVSKGDKKQPVYAVNNENWHNGDSSSATSGQGTGGVSELYDEHDRRIIEIMRNYGQPMLDEPTVNLVYNKNDGQVEIKWEDPADISIDSPVQIAWTGTIVIRKEGKAPLHRWGTEHPEYGGTVLVTSTTRDEYKTTAFVDNTIEANKKYYYVIAPYFVSPDDNRNHYRWTKVISVDTQRVIVAPTILTAVADHTTVNVAYIIPSLEIGTYANLKLAAKKDKIPASLDDADRVVVLTEPTNPSRLGGASISGLDEFSNYYFVVFVEDDQGNTANSDSAECKTGEVEFKTKNLLSNSRVYRHPVLAPFQVNCPSNDNYYNWFFTYYCELQAGGNGGTSGNTNIFFKVPIRRYKAKKMYVKLNGTTSNISYENCFVIFAKDLTPKAMGGDGNWWFRYYFVQDNHSYGPGVVPSGSFPNFAMQVVEIDISSVDAGQPFYLRFFKCNFGTQIREIYFDDDIEVCYDMMPNKVRVLLDYDNEITDTIMGSRTVIAAGGNASQWNLADNKLVNSGSSLAFDNVIINANLIRHKATKLYVEVATAIYNELTQNTASLVLAIPGLFTTGSGYSSESSYDTNAVDSTNNFSTYFYYNYQKRLRKLPRAINTSLAKTLLEYDISDIAADSAFQILFDVKHETMEITKIYFDADVIILNDKVQVPHNSYVEPVPV